MGGRKGVVVDAWGECIHREALKTNLETLQVIEKTGMSKDKGLSRAIYPRNSGPQCGKMVLWRESTSPATVTCSGGG